MTIHRLQWKRWGGAPGIGLSGVRAPRPRRGGDCDGSPPGDPGKDDPHRLMPNAARSCTVSHQSPPVLIMAAGAGTRMWPLCEQRPKPLLPVAGKPLIHHLLDGLIAIGVREVVVLVHWQGQALRRYLLSPQRQWPADLQLRLLDQGQPLGTGHAVLRGGADFQQPFLCLNGDVLVDPPALQGFVRSAIAASGPGQEVVMALTEVPDVGRYGAVTVDGPRVVGLAEKSGQARPGTINAGLYRFTPEFVALLEGLPPSPRGEVEVTDGLTRWLQQGTPVRGVPLQGRWRELTHPWDLLTLNEEWCEGLAPAVEGTVEGRRGRVRATVVELPFLDLPRKRG